MNERIRELAHEAGLLTYNPDGIPTKLEKFAELIVRECANAANDWYQNHEQLHWDPSAHVLAHFGVE